MRDGCRGLGRAGTGSTASLTRSMYRKYGPSGKILAMAASACRSKLVGSGNGKESAAALFEPRGQRGEASGSVGSHCRNDLHAHAAGGRGVSEAKWARRRAGLTAVQKFELHGVAAAVNERTQLPLEDGRARPHAWQVLNNY